MADTRVRDAESGAPPRPQCRRRYGERPTAALAVPVEDGHDAHGSHSAELVHEVLLDRLVGRAADDARLRRMDRWPALVLQVIGQEISLASAAAIRGRLEALHDGSLPTPRELLFVDDETLRAIGLSHAKVRYLRDLAARLVDGRLDLERLRALDDDAARDELTQVKGVGRFTADGVLLLALRRHDIWPAGDLALRRAVARVWELDGPLSVADADAVGERFRPWRTLAAVYLLSVPG